MFDCVERIHKEGPLRGGSAGITEFILDLKDVVENPSAEQPFTCWMADFCPLFTIHYSLSNVSSTQQ